MLSSGRLRLRCRVAALVAVQRAMLDYRRLRLGNKLMQLMQLCY